MISKNQVQVINLFRKDIFLEASIRGITKILKKRSYQRVYDAVKELKENGVLNIKRVGHSNLISISLTHETISMLAFLEEQEARTKKIPNYEKIISIKEISQYLIIVTGSYAKKTYTKSSDLDLVIIVPDNQKAMDIQKLVENLTLLFIPKLHLYVFNNGDFVEMLLDKKENYGKEIFKNKIIIKNAYIYYELLKEAIENGFRG